MWRDGVESGDSFGALPHSRSGSRGPAGNIRGLLFMSAFSMRKGRIPTACVCGEANTRCTPRCSVPWS